ncbi:hypothetical protein N6L26_07160 [Qipengyuania sp. SS22]|uniref:hypothetical protein n=1 Tax=Qipengyuania sp. SS22 TaxID=2979461 RepID=UPI0021E5FB0D|nr:hypothetical protein [Qipengyuania sp. SS22]UYH53856.1 hypothetical protein N6L26_07160 [Qipengyuania sp. SS22]
MAPAAALSPAAAPAPTSPLGKTVGCAPEEERIFSCKVASGKRIAICGTGEREAEYRFGESTPELVLRGGRWASVPYSGGGEAQVAFASGTTRYIVFSRVVRTNFAAGEPNNPAISDGVMVLDGEKVIGLQLCDDADIVSIDYDLAEAHFPRADELFSWETDRADRRTR